MIGFYIPSIGQFCHKNIHATHYTDKSCPLSTWVEKTKYCEKQSVEASDFQIENVHTDCQHYLLFYFWQYLSFFGYLQWGTRKLLHWPGEKANMHWAYALLFSYAASILFKPSNPILERNHFMYGPGNPLYASKQRHVSSTITLPPTYNK